MNVKSAVKRLALSRPEARNFTAVFPQWGGTIGGANVESAARHRRVA